MHLSAQLAASPRLGAMHRVLVIHFRYRASIRLGPFNAIPAKTVQLLQSIIPKNLPLITSIDNRVVNQMTFCEG
jgi:hypothetical protein